MIIRIDAFVAIDWKFAKRKKIPFVDIPNTTVTITRNPKAQNTADLFMSHIAAR